MQPHNVKITIYVYNVLTHTLQYKNADIFVGFAQNTTEHTRHPYRVIEQCALPIIHPDWSADEELLLIEASETAGLGNWADVAEQVTSRSKEELEKHYLECYINSPEYPLPVCPVILYRHVEGRLIERYWIPYTRLTRNSSGLGKSNVSMIVVRLQRFHYKRNSKPSHQRRLVMK